MQQLTQYLRPERGEFLQGVIDVTEERDGSHRIVDEDASLFLIDAAFNYADENFGSENGISSSLMRSLSEAKSELGESVESSSEEASDTSADDIDTFLMAHFREWDEDKLFRDGILKSSHRTDIDAIVDGMISDGMTDVGSIIGLMEKFPEGNEKAQGAVIQSLLTKLPAEDLEDAMPYLVGQVLVLEDSGDLNEDDIESIFDAIAESDNDEAVLEYLQDLGLDIDSLTDKGLVDEMQENEEFREYVMEDWSEIMKDESSKDDGEIDDVFDKILGLEDGDEGSSSSTDDTQAPLSTPPGVAPPQGYPPFMPGMGGGMGGMPGMGGMFGMGMGAFMLNSSFGFGYAQGVSDTIMAGVGLGPLGGGMLGGGGLSIYGR